MVLNSVYEKHNIRHIKMIKVEWIRTGRTNECCVFNECYENSFWNWPGEGNIDTDLMCLRSRTKHFNLSVCNRIMYFSFHSQNIIQQRQQWLC